MMSGFLVSFIENWKITLVMMTAGPVLAIIQGIADKVRCISLRGCVCNTGCVGLIEVDRLTFSKIKFESEPFQVFHQGV